MWLASHCLLQSQPGLPRSQGNDPMAFAVRGAELFREFWHAVDKKERAFLCLPHLDSAIWLLHGRCQAFADHVLLQRCAGLRAMQVWPDT